MIRILRTGHLLIWTSLPLYSTNTLAVNNGVKWLAPLHLCLKDVSLYCMLCIVLGLFLGIYRRVKNHIMGLRKRRCHVQYVTTSVKIIIHHFAKAQSTLSLLAQDHK